MGGGNSPADPLFWAHHNFIDRAWYEWQKSHSSRSSECGQCNVLETMTVNEAHSAQDYVGRHDASDDCVNYPASNARICLKYQARGGQNDGSRRLAGSGQCKNLLAQINNGQCSLEELKKIPRVSDGTCNSDVDKFDGEALFMKASLDACWKKNKKAGRKLSSLASSLGGALGGVAEGVFGGIEGAATSAVDRLWKKATEELVSNKRADAALDASIAALDAALGTAFTDSAVAEIRGAIADAREMMKEKIPKLRKSFADYIKQKPPPRAAQNDAEKRLCFSCDFTCTGR